MTARAVDGESVLLERAGGRLHQLNRTASFVWTPLDGRTSPREIAVAVAEAVEVEQEAPAATGTRCWSSSGIDLLAPEVARGGGG